MTIYNILFPFLILVALGIVIYTLIKHLPEAVEQHEILEKEEKKRWWQVLLGKGENLLRSVRVLILKIDNKLNASIKKVKEKKEKMGEGLREYRSQDNKQLNQKETFVKEENGIEIASEEARDVAYQAENDDTVEQNEPAPKDKTEEIKKSKGSIGKLARKVSFVFRHKQPGSTTGKTVEEITKKTFSPTELKVEKENYWKKKEELLIQSIIREPKNVGLYLQLGRLYSNQHNSKDARQAFLEVLKLDKTNIKAKEELKRIDKFTQE